MKANVIILILMSLTLSIYAQRNSFYYGDKNPENIEKSLEIVSAEVKSYQAKIDKINQENDKLLMRFEKSNNANIRESIKKKIQNNDSLYVLYQRMLIQNEKRRSDLVLSFAQKDNLAYVKSTGNNPAKLQAASEAYAIMRYADGSQSLNEGLSKLTGVVVNHWYKDVHVVVYGPGGYSKEFYLNSNGGKEVFDLSVPGNYTAVFSSGTEKRVVTKKVLPNPNSYSRYQGENYDFSAMLLRR